MPVRYQYQPRNHTIAIECSGELSITEISQYFREIEQDDGIPKGTIEMVDLRRITYFDLNHLEASTMPKNYSPAHAKKAIQATIVFGATPVNMGLATLIEAYFRKSMPNHLFKTVKTLQDAERMLEAIRSEIQSLGAD